MSKFICDGDVFKKKINGVDYELIIKVDDCAENPRDCDLNLCKMYCWHRRYTLGDVNPFEDIEACLKDCIESCNLPRSNKDTLMEVFDDESLSLKERHKKIIYTLAKHSDVYIQYLYLYDHSGITISTSDFHDPWDSGIVGFAVVYKKDVEENTAYKGDNWIVGAMEIISDEVETYDLYIRGECYGFDLYKIGECECCGQIERELVCSTISSFLGSDVFKSGLADSLQEYFDEFEDINFNVREFFEEDK